MVVVLPVAEEKVQLVAAEHALSLPCVDELPDEFDDGGTIRAAVGQVPDEGEPPTRGVRLLDRVPQHTKQIAQCVDLPMDIADDVDRVIEKRLDERIQSEAPAKAPRRGPPVVRSRTRVDRTRWSAAST